MWGLVGANYAAAIMRPSSVLLFTLFIGVANAGDHCNVCVNGAKYCDSTWLPALNLNRALTGVDISKKHPMPFKPESDPSVKKIIFESTHRNKNNLGNMEANKFIHLTDKLACSSEFETTAWMTTEQYIQGSASSSMSSWNVGYEGPTISGKIGKPDVAEISISLPPNTASYGNSNTETNDDIDYFFSVEKGSISHSQARCSVYTVDIDLKLLKLSSFHESFVKAIKDIDLAKTEKEKQYVMKNFIDNFGSHYAIKTIMGIGVLFETRYTQKETMNHNTQTRNECSSQSGGIRVAGLGSNFSKNKCKYSLKDTTQGENTRVKRFTSTSYGTLPTGTGSLSEWAGKANDMLTDGTLAPLPIQQDLRLILDLFATPAVANITHDDGSNVNVTNLFLTALDGYNNYRTQTDSYHEIHVPTCATTVLIKGIGTNGIVFRQVEGSGLNGRPIYKNSENLHLHFSKNERWIVSQNLTEIHMWKSSPCPQKGIEFEATAYAIGNGPLPGEVNKWKDCARKCFDHSNCKYWQHNIDTKRCSLIADYSSAQATLADVATGTRDCPGDKSLFAHGLCVENMSSRSMWLSQGTNIFEKDIEVDAFDPTFLIIAGGSNGNYLNNVEIIGKKYCNVPDLPDGNYAGNLVITAGDHRVLYCGGIGSGGASDLCYVLDVASGVWHQEDGRLSTSRYYSTAISMPDGVYILGGYRTGLTSEYLPTYENSWQVGPNVPYDFVYGCGVKITKEEFVIIGGLNSKKSVYSYNTKTSIWTRRPDMIEDRYHHSCSFHPPTNSIIVAGGRDSRSTTEIIPMDTWRPTKAGDLKQRRYHHAMVTVGGKHPTVYAIGGYVASRFLSSVEVWDQLKAEWKMAPASLNIARNQLAALAVPPSAIC